ncbi:hypothetical protein B0H67DRAFT_589017 [Lasiosphaeris hirsuta]|uniref:U1-C C2H2-type zinc finger domain-containing protein n=1 Tax=Lasiosphaeris hirsuta TaxID=260670 RepID=A0AA40A295_9PEZI|nr:hypothetical protein B0H67DRAFT_589017 [Lasiosphaeris hirsuta]
MSEYWKSTPKYWCKHCSIFVRDTKLERTNHESTGKHQGAIKRSLRDLHRNAEQKERDKDRAKREVDRLNGVVSGYAGSSSSARPTPQTSGGSSSAARQKVTEEERQRQLEQLADLGVNIPTELRGSMALAGEWTVTSTRIVNKSGTGKAADDSAVDEARATGLKRERERTEEEKEQEEAINGLFVKRRRWGVGSKTIPGEEDAELEALLNGPLIVAKKEEGDPSPEIKKEVDQETAAEEVKPKVKEEAETLPPIKVEYSEEVALGSVDAPKDGVPDPSTAEKTTEPVVMFKKRKPKNLRQE